MGGKEEEFEDEDKQAAFTQAKELVRGWTCLFTAAVSSEQTKSVRCQEE